MATVKSKLKEQLQKEKELATDSLLDVSQDEGKEMARQWVVNKFNGQKIKLSFIRSVLTRAKEN